MTRNLENGKDPDVIVIGGGPAGSTAATLMAQQGLRAISAPAWSWTPAARPAC
ncbi:MAG TPA: FAD-dependent monooxygenase [Terriglobia bacterium]|nr:FAD-dependent monooxygenase [Terriglobia bacterium]